MEETAYYLTSGSALISLAGLALIALSAGAYVVGRRQGGRAVRPSTLVWMAPHALLELVISNFCLQGDVEAYPAAFVLTSLVVAACGAAVPLRERTWGLGDRVAGLVERLLPAGSAGRPHARAATARGVRALRDLAVIALCCCLAYVALEVPWNSRALKIDPAYSVIEALLIAGMMALGYFLAQRRGVGPALVTCALGLLGIAQYFVGGSKNSGILPSDLLAAGTAVAVAGRYQYDLTGMCLVALGCISVACLACSLVTPAPARDHHERVGRLSSNLICSGLCVVALAWGITVPSYKDDLGLSMDYWNTLYSYGSQGFLPSFVTVLQNLGIEKPEGYEKRATTQELESAAQAYDEGRGSSEGMQQARSQFEGQKPSVVAIMNETFSDLSTFNNLLSGYEGPQRLKSVPDALGMGGLAVSTYGGGTCNTEFEFLTGNSLAYVGAGKNPYTLYDFAKVDTLPRQLKELGYDTTAIHPQPGSNWNRASVYREMGFDTFLDYDAAFEGAPELHSGPTDAVTYDKILEVLASDDDPQFIFDVTMQNHSSYTQNNIPEELKTHYAPEGMGTEQDNAQLNEYLSCIEASDRDLADFIAKLRELDRPVILVFFGDHQPNISARYNDAIFASDEGSIEHEERIYQTSWLMWANYDVEGFSQLSEWSDTDASTLAAQTLEAAGIPLTSHQKARLGSTQAMPVVNLFGYKDRSGTWHALPASGLVEDEETEDKTYETVGTNAATVMRGTRDIVGLVRTGDRAGLKDYLETVAHLNDEVESEDAATGEETTSEEESEALAAFDSLAHIQYLTFGTKV